MASYQIQNVQPYQLLDVHKLYLLIGWDSKLEYLSLLYNLQPQAWLCATGDEANLKGVGIFWILDDHNARIGKLATHPGDRGKGIGKALMAAGLRYLNGRNIGLSAVSTYQPMYEKWGFFTSTSRQIIYYKGIPMKRHKLFVGKEIKIVSVFSDIFDSLLTYDTTIHGINRESLLKARIKSHIFQTYAALDKNKDVVGYGCCWKTDRNYRINPLYADNVTVAKQLVIRLISNIPADERVKIYTYLDSDKLEFWRDVFGEEIKKESAELQVVQMFTKFDRFVEKDKVYSLFDADASFV